MAAGAPEVAGSLEVLQTNSLSLWAEPKWELHNKQVSRDVKRSQARASHGAVDALQNCGGVIAEGAAASLTVDIDGTADLGSVRPKDEVDYDYAAFFGTAPDCRLHRAHGLEHVAGAWPTVWTSRSIR